MNEFTTRAEAGERLKRGGWKQVIIRSAAHPEGEPNLPCEMYERNGWLALITDEGVLYNSPEKTGLRPNKA